MSNSNESINKTMNELTEKRKGVNTFEELISFLRDVKENYNTTYGVAPRAIAQAALAVAWYLSSEFEITGFQASFITWEFIYGFGRPDSKCGLKLVDYDDMLYPQYQYRYEKTISKDTWDKIQEQAKHNLDNIDHASPNVINHWKSIVSGKIPFGYTVSNN